MEMATWTADGPAHLQLPFAGDRFTEAVHINKSLFALQGVVAALADGKPHIPYRNDPLTQLSLSGIADSLQLSPRILGAVKLGSSRSNPSLP